MNTFNDKLLAIENTKDAIKEAIISKGVSVTNSDTFRSYADKIRQIEGGSFKTYATFNDYVKTLGLENELNPVISNRHVYVTGGYDGTIVYSGYSHSLQNNGLGAIRTGKDYSSEGQGKHGYEIETYGGLEGLNKNLQSFTAENLTIERLNPDKGTTNDSTFNLFYGKRQDTNHLYWGNATCNLKNIRIVGVSTEHLLAAPQTLNTNFGMFSGVFSTFNLDNIITEKNSYGNLFGEIHKSYGDPWPLKTVNFKNMDTTKYVGTIFYRSGPENLTFENCNGWGQNDYTLYYSGAPLTRQSCLNLFNVLAYLTHSGTLQLNWDTYKSLSKNDLAIATNKGWTVTSN